jgi:molybdopterin-guanine dinucleotide biosynthesis protein A
VIVGVVLAGGRSTRMGRDKASIEVAPGERLVDRVVAAVRAALAAAGETEPRVVVSGEVAGHDCVPDAAAGLGPVAGIAAAVAALRGSASALLVVPVDLPALDGAALLPLLRARPPAAYAGSALPALLGTDAATVAAVEATLAAAGRDRSVTALLARLGAGEVPLDAAHARALTNANTPAELRDALGGTGG